MAIKDLLMVANRSPASAQRLESALALVAQFSARATAIALAPI
jgi:hypothetical protein